MLSVYLEEEIFFVVPCPRTKSTGFQTNDLFRRTKDKTMCFSGRNKLEDQPQLVLFVTCFGYCSILLPTTNIKENIPMKAVLEEMGGSL